MIEIVGTHDLDLKQIESEFQPAGRYRITKSDYPPGTAFGGSMRVCDIYVLEGRCRIMTPSGGAIELSGGNIAQLLVEGDYDLTVLGSRPLSIVKVWKLPEKFWK